MNTKNPILKGYRNKEDYKKNSLSASDFAKLFYGIFKEDSGPG